MDFPLTQMEFEKKFSSEQKCFEYYDKLKVLHDISFDVEEGEIFGLIRPDGAGKSTLFRILATLLLPDSGTATVAGMDVIKDFREIRNNKNSLLPAIGWEEVSVVSSKFMLCFAVIRTHPAN